ncbi:hypothetical protein BJX99DRAFT_266848 [Aspergillus californicus]
MHCATLVWAASLLVPSSLGLPSGGCRCMPGDSCWPDGSSSSIMATVVANATCDAFTPRSQPCGLGNQVVYAVNASSPDNFSKTILFSQERNVRLVIRNTGHDHLGKSTGAGSLSIWTHHLKEVKFRYYTSSHYTGPAVTMAAGVQGMDIYQAADIRGLVVVGGECSTVGVAGGYTQGGGHSALSSRFGLGADQVLDWQVVDGTGRFLTASPTKNPDLYWSLSGGGGGTYGVVFSMTVKTYPDFPVTGVVLGFNADSENSESFFEAVGHYHRYLPTYTAAGGMAIALISNPSFLLTPLTLPAMRADTAMALLTPFLGELERLGIRYELNVTQSPTYLEHYMQLIEPNPTQLVQNGQYGGRILSISGIENNNTQLTAAVKAITGDGVTFVGIGLNVSSSVAGNVRNSVLPAWRTAALNVILSTAWPAGANLTTMDALARAMTTKWVPILTSLAPDSEVYMNEADPQQPGWQQEFYGPNYNRLLTIKARYDPFGTFNTHTAVGSENWRVGADGRLCRAGDITK